MYSITEAAAAIGVERSTVRAWCKRGRMMGAVRVGKYAWHIPASTVANAVEYVASNHHVRLLGDPLTGNDAQIIELGVRIVAAADTYTGDAA